MVTPPVLGYLVAADGVIENRRSLLVLWCAAFAAAVGSGVLAWMAINKDPRTSTMRWRLALAGRGCWRWRYRLALVMTCAATIGLIGFASYVHCVNGVDLLERLEPSHPLSRTVHNIAVSQGKAAALDALANKCRAHGPTVRLTPYQLWDTAAEVSTMRRQAFLAGDLQAAIGKSTTIRWQPGESVPWATHSEADRPFCLQRQRFLFDVLRDSGTGASKAVLGRSAAFVDDWRRSNPLWPNRNRYAWNDDATSNRIQAHMLLMDRRRAHGLSSKEEELAFLTSLMQHADQLMDENRYTSSTNHGMMQNAALLSIAVGYPEFDKKGRWQRTAVERTERYVRQSVSADGVLQELTPGYHWFGTVQLLWFVATCRQEGIQLDPAVEQAVRKMLKFCRELLQPDRTLPMIADTHAHRRTLADWPVSELPDWPEIAALRAATNDMSKMPNGPCARLWGDSAYSILRTGSSPWAPRSAMMLVFKLGSATRAHYHPDALSLAMYANDHAVLSGPGYPDYVLGAGRLDEMATTKQNAVSVDSRSQQCAVAGSVRFFITRPEILGAAARPQLAVIQAEARVYPEVRHRRSLLYGPSPTAVLVLDELSSHAGHDYRQNFRMAEDCAGRLEADCFRVSTASDNRFLLKITARGVHAHRVELLCPEYQHPRVAFPGHGRNFTYVTELQWGEGPSSVQINAAQQTIAWTGTEGEITVKLPFNTRSDLRWTVVR